MTVKAIDYEVRRVAFNQDEFDEVYKYERPTRPFREVLKERLEEMLKIDPWELLKDWIPLIGWLSTYKKSYLLGDIMAGFTLAIMNVPQGMFALLSLMVGAVTTRLADPNETNMTMPESDPNKLGDLRSVQVAVAVTFTSGVILAIMAILQLHFVASYMSDQLIGGFTTGAAFHVAASQLPKLFGLKIPSYQGLFKLFYILRDVILSLPETNIADLVTSIICIVFLHVGKWYINPFVRKRIPIIIPFELIAVIVATALSYGLNFHEKFHMSIVSTIPTGFPSPKPPNFSLIPDVIVDSIVISVVAFAITISMCKLFGQKHGYAVKGSQELRALALLQLVGSFFLCHPSCTSISRAAVMSQSGVNTQLGGAITACLMLVVILWAGVLLEPLPKCILSSIIIVALQGMFLQAKKTRQLWAMSKIDLAIWLVAFLGTFLWDVAEGLAIAIAFALITVIFRTQWPKAAKLVQVGDTEIYRDIHRYQVHTSFSHIVIFRYDAPLLFFNSENFKERALEEVEKQENELRTVIASHSNTEAENSVEQVKKPNRIYDLPHLHFTRHKDKKEHDRMVRYLIIDASGFTHMDQMGVMSFKDLADEMAKKRVEVLIASCRAKVRQKCLQCGLFESVPQSHFFPSIHDAVLFAIHKDEIEKAKKLAADGTYLRHRGRSAVGNLTFIERNTGRKASLISSNTDMKQTEIELNSLSEEQPSPEPINEDSGKKLDDVFGCDSLEGKLEQRIDMDINEETKVKPNGDDAASSDESEMKSNKVDIKDEFQA
ncbi:Prestin [Toxocara canis]|uniref:Prestin n=1 Tax=Toxocara canis TaxID=6265 RepID=A0A0B2VPZ1_TOXCA|nr:Prestin [Toxocara canis]